MTAHSPRSLPPLVEGDVYGYLKVTIDEVLWCQNCPSNVVALMQWWGELDSISLRPNDVTKYPEPIKENNSVLYNIQTNFQLFKSYLKQCSKLKFLMINDKTKEIIGHVTVNNLLELITGIQYQQYFPIITTSGIRVGDLRVDFELTMNSLPEEIASKKSKKRSRRKNKSNQNSLRTSDDEKCKQIKRGCKVCSESLKTNSRSTTAGNKLNLETLKSPVSCKVPPNTQRSEASDCTLWEVLDKGKKLRDAMVLSVLEEDSCGNINDKLLLQPESDCDTIYEPLKLKNGDFVSSYEDKLINDYLEGKAMKEEEVLVLNALHGVEKTKNGGDMKKKDCGLASRKNHPSSVSGVKNGPDSELETFITSNGNLNDGSEMNKILDEVNCFRLTMDSLTLTKAGWKKINNCLENKTKNCNEEPPPGATYFVECHFVEESPHSVTQLWKTTPLRFCSRRQIENVVYFGQSCAQSLRPQAHIVTELAAASCVVCWRHLNQRVPSRLGNFSLAEVLLPSQGCLQTSATVSVMDSNVTVAHLRLSITLGRDKLCYGEDLRSLLQGDKPTSVRPAIESKKNQVEEILLKVSDLTVNTKPLVIPTCTNCSKMLVLSPSASSLCSSCVQLLAPHQNLSSEPQIMPTKFKSEYLRHHEFLIGVDSVIGFPLFAGIKEELSCYVDYKFPEITSSLRAVMSHRETTSRVVPCEPHVSVSSVHRHELQLPVALPLSPLLAACSPGITLRLWLRYYQPSPRDHMVALALLPMDELNLMELEYDQKQQKSAVIKVLELPLALVPSSVTSQYQQYHNLGVLRVTVTYSNMIASEQDLEEEELQVIPQRDGPERIPAVNYSDSHCRKEVVPIDNLLDQITGATFEDLKAAKNRFWTGPFGQDKRTVDKIDFGKEPSCFQENSPSSATDPVRDISVNKSVRSDCSRPVMKEEFDILAESLEQRFNQLQSDLIKTTKLDHSEEPDTGNFNCRSNKDFVGFQSLSLDSSIESLPFILGPPADFKDAQNTHILTQTKSLLSGTESDKSDSDTICGFLKEEKTVENLGSNEAFEREESKFKPVETKTFKANIKIDRAVNMKAIRGPLNGKKGKIPPSTWVSFGIGECCGGDELVCSDTKYNTSVVRRNYNPVWNIAWDVDLPVTYLQQVNKRLVFRIFEENLNAAFGVASANLSILTSGLPCLSSWLSINDLSGACKGQIKVIVTPLEDVSKYQDCSVFYNEEDEFEELHKCEYSSDSERGVTDVVAPSQTEVVVSNSDSETSNKLDKEVEQLMLPSGNSDDLVSEDAFCADDVISDYKNTLENNFRNEMAGLDNLIQFLRVGSMNNELTENKENLSFNPSFHQPTSDTKMAASPLINHSVCNELCGQIEAQPKVLIDASTDTKDKSAPISGEDIITKLLQQISMFQLPTVKISDNTSQTLNPETKERFTETVVEDPVVVASDASTQTDNDDNTQPHVCGALIQHFLTCKPTTVKVCDNFSQTTSEETVPTTDSSGVFMSSCMSSGILLPSKQDLPNYTYPNVALENCDRLVTIDNNIRDLERFLKENLILTDKTDIPLDSTEGSSCGSLNGVMDSVKQDSPSSSDVESLGSYSQVLVVPRETPDGGNVSAEPAIRRQGTFIIDKPNTCRELVTKEIEDNHKT